MRIAALVVGLLGGLLGLFLEVRTVAEGWQTLPSGGAALAAVILMLAIAALIVGSGIVGALLAPRRPLAAGILMLVSGVIGAPAVPGYMFAGPVLVVGAVLAFIAAFWGRRKMRAAPAVTPPPPPTGTAPGGARSRPPSGR